MDPEYVQHLRYKLQKRVRRLNSVDWQLFQPMLKQFWAFFESYPTFTGIVEELLSREPQSKDDADSILEESAGLVGDTEQENAAIAYRVLRKLAEAQRIETPLNNIGMAYGAGPKMSMGLDLIRDLFLESFYEYVDEHLDDQRAMLALLRRYKHRSEWFYRNELIEQAELGERNLALNLYSYLYDQGVDFNIQPWSASGEVDLIAAQESNDPLIADAKIFDGDSRGKSYILKGFNQIYSYTRDYNQPFGCLVIFKTCERDLKFSLAERAQKTPVVIHNNKTIFLLTVDIHKYEESASKRGRLKEVVEITEDALIETVEET